MQFLNKYKTYLSALLACFIGFYIAFEVLGPILNDNNVVQDDFRQTNFWFWKFWDPKLFPNDYFAKVYESNFFALAPIYALIWRAMPLFTDNLIHASKLYALGLSVISAFASFFFINRFTKNRNLFFSIAFVLAMTVTFWCTDNLSASHMRSTIWFFLFLYMGFKESKQDIAASITCLIALFYNPTAFVICMGMEGFSWLFSAKSKFLSPTFYGFTINTLITFLYHFVFLKGVKYAGEGHHLSRAEMMSLPEFNVGGRIPIFGFSGTESWWMNENWGLGIGYFPISVKVVSFAVIVLILYFAIVQPSFNDFKQSLSSSPALLIYSSIALYFISGWVFPLLYFPSRYLGISCLILSVFCIFYCFFSILTKTLGKQQFLINLCIVIAALSFWVCFKKDYHPRFVSANPQVTNYAQALGPDALIAGHPYLPDLNILYITAKRKVFIDLERSAGFTMKSVEEIRRRTIVSFDLTYAKSREEFLALVKANGITHFMALADFYAPGYLKSPKKYIEPFNQHVNQITVLAPGQQFFILNHLMKHKSRYMIIDIAKL